MSVGKVCVRTVVTTSPEESVAAAAKRMRQYNVGSWSLSKGSNQWGLSRIGTWWSGLWQQRACQVRGRCER